MGNNTSELMPYWLGSSLQLLEWFVWSLGLRRNPKWTIWNLLKSDEENSPSHTSQWRISSETLRMWWTPPYELTGIGYTAGFSTRLVRSVHHHLLSSLGVWIHSTDRHQSEVQDNGEAGNWRTSRNTHLVSIHWYWNGAICLLFKREVQSYWGFTFHHALWDLQDLVAANYCDASGIRFLLHPVEALIFQSPQVTPSEPSQSFFTSLCYVVFMSGNFKWIPMPSL